MNVEIPLPDGSLVAVMSHLLCLGLTLLIATPQPPCQPSTWKLSVADACGMCTERGRTLSARSSQGKADTESVVRSHPPQPHSPPYPPPPPELQLPQSSSSQSCSQRLPPPRTSPCRAAGSDGWSSGALCRKTVLAAFGPGSPWVS